MVNAANPHNLQWSFGTLYGLTILALMVAFNSAYLMINLAQEEKLSAAFAVNLIINKVMARPADLLLAWLLSMGIQLASLILPALTVVGMFFLPSIWFAGQVLSALVLAQAWSAVTRDAQSYCLTTVFRRPSCVK